MSVSVSMQGPTMLIEFHAAVSFQDLMALTKEVTAIEVRLGRAPNRIVDMIGATELLFGYSEFSALARDRAAMEIPNRYRIIMVASTEVGFGVARIFQTLATHADVEVTMVKSRAEAAALADSVA
jgi:hypothetical protein